MSAPATFERPPPDDPHPPYGRTGHPYFMHDMIVSVPEALERTVDSTFSRSAGIPRPPADRPVLFVGQGTSYHAALGAVAAGRELLGPRALLRAVSSFELLLDPDLVGAAGIAIVFSESGETAVTLQAQRALAAAGVPQVLVTASGASSSRRLAGEVLPTERSEERAWTHTVSFVSALAAAYALLSTWAGAAPGPVRGLAGAARAVLEREPDWRRLADRMRDRSRLMLLGSGVGEITVREAALKLREGAGRFVAWVGVEEFLHGTLPSVGPDTGVVALAGSVPELVRARDALRAAEIAGARSALLGPGADTSGGGEFLLPDVPRAFAPAVHVLAFQLWTYWTAVGEGRNPDVMGYDRPPIWAARRSFGI